MPYLRAALNPRKQPVKAKSEGRAKSRKSKIVNDDNIVLTLRRWMREDDRKRDGCFELSETKCRNRAIIWVTEILKAMHEE